MSQDFQCFILVATDRMWIAKTFNLCRFPELFGGFFQNRQKPQLIFRQKLAKFAISWHHSGSARSG